MQALVVAAVFVLAMVVLAGAVARTRIAPFGVGLVWVSAAVLIGAASYYAVDAVGRPPLRWLAENAVNGALFVAAVVAMIRGVRSLRAVTVAGLVLHGAWDLLHVLSVLSPPRHEWLPAACVLVDWTLAAVVWLVPLPPS
jgi:hypothetical protein